MRIFRRNSKALSPVIGSIVLIAVTVAVSIVVASWMGGISIDLMGNAEQATITNLQLHSTQTTIPVTIQNSGNSVVKIMAAYVNGQNVAFTGNATIAPAEAHVMTYRMILE